MGFPSFAVKATYYDYGLCLSYLVFPVNLSTLASCTILTNTNAGFGICEIFESDASVCHHKQMFRLKIEEK